MNRKIIVVIIMLVLICTVFTSVVTTVGKKETNIAESEDFISYAIKNPSPYTSRVVVLYFLFLLYRDSDERINILRDLYKI